MFKKYDLNVQLPKLSNQNIQNHFWVFGIVLKENINRELIINNLAEKGIETRPFFHPLHLQPAIKEMNLKRTPLPVSEKIGRQGFYIPIGKHVKPKLQKNIVLAIKNAIDEIG